MKRKLYSLVLTGLLMLVGQTAWAALQQNGDGAYLIGSKADLEAWAQVSGYESTNVVLTGDIQDLDFMLCTSKAYSGVFDGQGHTITLNYDFPGKQVALFCYLSGTVRNLVVDGYIKATYKNCAAFAGTQNGASTFENCVAAATIEVDYSANVSNAGFVGYTKYTSTYQNCISAIKVSGNQGFNHGFVGWISNNAAVSMTNCISIEEADTKETFSWGNPTGSIALTNCYSLQQDKDGVSPLSGSAYITYDQVRSGELCFKANGDQSRINWFQTLGKDTYPVPFGTHGTVYAVGEVNCAGVAIGDVTYSNDNSSPAPKHVDVNGRCSVCGTLLQDHLTPNAQGFYELATVADVEWFSAMVGEAHKTEIKGCLTADIDFGGEVNAHTPIGPNTTYKYNGVFDGQGHHIKGMVIDANANFQGFFGALRGGTTIRNLIIDADCSVTGPNCIGGLVGAVQTSTGSPVVIENCVNAATVTATNGTASGFIGAGQSSYPVIQLTNCLNTGHITAKTATAFCSWINMGGSSMTSCVNTGTITGADMAGGKYPYFCQLIRYEPNTLTMTNCFDFSDFDDEGAGHQGTSEEWMTEDPAAGGELCFLLNGDQSNIVWHQRLGQDDMPVPYYIEGGVVYAGGELSCDGTPLDVTGYSNSRIGTIPPHEYEDGFCVNCGQGNPEYAPLEDGYYMISNGSQLWWFSRMVNELGKADWNARLTQDIDLADYQDLIEPIGCVAYPYRGHFDGQQHTISNLSINTSNNYAGLFGRVAGGAVIENTLLDETCVISTYGECAAFVGGVYQTGGNVILRGLGNKGNVYAGGVQAAGIFGGNTGSQATILIENCFSTGAIEGGSDCSALVGWGGSGGKATISNCWSCSEVSGYSEGKNLYFARVTDGHLTNNYCTSEIEQQANVALITYEEIASGALCYKLNGDQSSVAWYQNLDNGAEADDQPVPFSQGHAQVYPKGKMLCDGTVDPTGIAYSNSKDVVIPDHQFEDGFCPVCGQEDPDYTGFLAIIKNPNFNNDGNFWTGTELSVSAGVAQQSGKTFDTYQVISDLQNGVYKLRLQGFSRAAALDSEAYADYDENLMRNTYYYAESAGLRQARRLMDITEGSKEAPIHDGVGEVLTDGGNYVPGTAAAAAYYMGKGNYWNAPLYLAVTDGTLKVGFANQVDSKDTWNVIDRIRIEYVGDDSEAYALIAAQIADDAQDLDDVEGQETLKADYQKVIAGAAGLTEAEAILAAADKASRLPDQIKLSAAAYARYSAVVAAIRAEREGRDDLIGDDADILDTYLTEDEEPSETYPNGTYEYISSTRLLDAEQLAAEADFARRLLQNAILSGAGEGSDMTSLIVNPKFDDATAWNGWTVTEGRTESGYNLVHNSGFPDVFPVAAAYNMGFEVSQEITGLKDGIYALTANAFYRPGQGRAGLVDGTDVIPAQLFIGEFAAPVMSVYSDQISFEKAENGVNCRYDATGDPEAPHNGEQTGQVDIMLDEGYIPDNTYTASFAFNGDRYENTVYAIVRDGKMSLGIRSSANPWHAKNLTIWGNFRLTYLGQSSAAIQDILEQYSQRIERLDLQRMEQNYFLSQSHFDNIQGMIAQARTADKAKQLELIEAINDEFNAVCHSVELYKTLLELAIFAQDMADGLPYDSPVAEEMFNISAELNDIVVEGSLNDSEAEQKIAELMENEAIGGVVYVQGDLYDENSDNQEWNYSQMCPLYPLYKNAEGKFVGTVTLQDRSRRIGGYQRAGVYFRRINTSYKAVDADRRFITPSRNQFSIQEGGSDFQALNGTYDIVLDLDAMTVEFNQKDAYNWDNAVFVTGTLNNKGGSLMRWKNDEQVPLQHLGGGMYAGVVDLVNDNSNPFCSFGIMACRSTEDMVNYSTTTRGSWTEARYGSAEQYLELRSGDVAADLVRGLDRTWRISPAGKYYIEFDMDNATMTATLLETKGNGTEGNPYQIATKQDLQSLRDRLVDQKTVYARLTADIDMEGEGWWPMNSTFQYNSFNEGYGRALNLDGANHVIKNLNVAAHLENYYETGLFGCLNGAVRNLGLYNATVDGGEAENAGILAGMLGTEESAALVENCYVHGQLTADAAAGAVAGSVLGESTVLNVYANANVTGNGTCGDFIGTGSDMLSVISSYAAGQANGSEATALFGDEQGTLLKDVLYYDGTNQEALATTVSGWTGWHENGTIGCGFPLLQWQVERGDYAQLCGYGSQLKGDVNGDGAVTIQDVVAVLEVMAADSNDPAADVNGDKAVTIQDVVAVLEIMAAQ